MRSRNYDGYGTDLFGGYDLIKQDGGDGRYCRVGNYAGWGDYIDEAQTEARNTDLTLRLQDGSIATVKDSPNGTGRDISITWNKTKDLHHPALYAEAEPSVREEILEMIQEFDQRIPTKTS